MELTMLRGAIHIHSTYSDGEFTLCELREMYTSVGCAFACMTDHASSFDTQKLRAYVRECDSLSDDRFRFIAGLEYGCNGRMHILGLGVTSLVDAKDPQEVISHIENFGGISVIAHPMDTAFEWIKSFNVLPNGIETWNSKYDGRYAPRPATFRLLHQMQERKPDMLAFYGQDLHWKKQFRGLFNMVKCQTPTREEILFALKSGDYFAIKGHLELPSHGNLLADLLERFANTHDRSDGMRRLIKKANDMTNKYAVTVPAQFKAQLRRIL